MIYGKVKLKYMIIVNYPINYKKFKYKYYFNYKYFKKIQK